MGPEQAAVSYASRVVGRPQGPVDRMRAEQLRCAKGARLGYCHNDAKLKAEVRDRSS